MTSARSLLYDSAADASGYYWLAGDPHQASVVLFFFLILDGACVSFPRVTLPCGDVGCLVLLILGLGETRSYVSSMACGASPSSLAMIAVILYGRAHECEVRWVGFEPLVVVGGP